METEFERSRFREAFVTPWPRDPTSSSGLNHATLVTRVANICEELAPGLVWSVRSPTSPALAVGDDERCVLDFLDDVPVTADLLMGRLAMSPGGVAFALAKLEVRGLAARTNVGYGISERGCRLRTSHAIE
jgi:predicted Rossmann fold nucleotide-binding protein DprA/Smf involved in DNA uptake